jgi:hypothetical protein
VLVLDAPEDEVACVDGIVVDVVAVCWALRVVEVHPPTTTAATRSARAGFLVAFSIMSGPHYSDGML